jgi:two-component system sensor histidine kinase KdpD
VTSGLVARLTSLRGPARHLTASAGSILGVVFVTGAMKLLELADVPTLSLGALYLFAIVPIAVLWGLVYAVPASVVSMLAYNFFFLPPLYTFTLDDSRNWFALAVYLVTAVVVSDLAARARRRADDAEQREHESALLADAATDLLRGHDVAEQLERIAGDAARVLGVERARLELGPPRDLPGGDAPLELEADGRVVATLYVPEPSEPTLAIRRRFLPALGLLLAVAVEREALARDALEAETLRRSDTVKTAVLRAVSHDLRSPLTAIQASVQGLTSPSLVLSEEERASLLDTIAVEAQRLDRLVRNLLDLSRLQAHAARPAAELWSLDDLVGQALVEIGRGEQRVRVALPETLPPVRVDASQIERVLVNLLENALKFSPPDEPIDIQATATRDQVLVRVIDHGPGIPARDLERIFEPFESSGASRLRGTGLGLAICRGFVEANGGRIWAESQLGQGASLVLALPAAPSLERVPA